MKPSERIDGEMDQLVSDLVWKYPGLELDAWTRVRDHADGERVLGAVILHRIIVSESERGTGTGSKVMSEICQFADRHALTIGLDPDIHLGASSMSALLRFYERHGFVTNSGSKRDHSLMYTMRRDPRPITPKLSAIDQARPAADATRGSGPSPRAGR